MARYPLPTNAERNPRDDLVERVRRSCAAAAQSARLVSICADRIPPYARELAAMPDVRPSLDPVTHYLGHGVETLAFFVTLDTVNFGSGYFPLLRKRPGMSGYFTIASSLTDRFTQRGPWRSDELAAISPEECARVFGQEDHPPEIDELMMLFSQALRELGALLIERYRGDFTSLIAAAGHSANRLVGLLADMPLFRDVSPFRGMEIPFYKRAQLMAADLALAFDGKGHGAFADLNRLTIFADNLVPHVLRVDGVLGYDETLLARIDAGELIPSGSPEEVEIRACAVHAVELLVHEVTRLGRPISAHVIDYVLWTRGQKPAYKSVPRHRTRTTAY